MEPKIADAARHFPGVCSGCATATGPFVDTGRNLGHDPDDPEFAGYGWLYFCRKCVAVMAGVFGFETPEEVEERRAAEADLREQLDDLQAALEEARAARVVPIDQVMDAVRAELAATMPTKVVESPKPPKPKAAA